MTREEAQQEIHRMATIIAEAYVSNTATRHTTSLIVKHSLANFLPLDIQLGAGPSELAKRNALQEALLRIMPKKLDEAVNYAKRVGNERLMEYVFSDKNIEDYKRYLDKAAYYSESIAAEYFTASTDYKADCIAARANQESKLEFHGR